MCLIDEIVSWDATSIRSRSATHRAPDNPLRSGGRLPVWCAIEYAAQTMAVHGALSGAVSSKPRTGYLVSLRNVVAHAPHLDGPDGDLTVEAQHLRSDDALAVYAFRVRVGPNGLLEGTATVILRAEEA